MDFASTPVEVNLLLGTTVFPLAEIKKLDAGDIEMLRTGEHSVHAPLTAEYFGQRPGVHTLDAGDIVLFENSSSSEMTLMCENIVQKFKVKPNIKIIEPYDMSGGNEMDNTNTNLWDSIQVDMSAEFDKVKVTLGELKSIEEGLIVDLCSVYDNKVSLKVGGKLVATGELVIINDRFGVRIEQVSDSSATGSASTAQPEPQQEETPQTEATGESEFDYSDFEPEGSNEG